MIYVGKGVKKINTFKVFSRWGEQLYAARNFYPNDNSYGWDGKFKGEKMNPGVYIYFVEIEFSDGLKIIYNGDVTLTR
jgi:gliding motility-associated-like protein